MTRYYIGVALLLAASGLGGCPEISGGAVEVAWVLRTADNRPTPCDSDWLIDQYKIDRIRLRITPEDDPGMDLCAGVDPPSICEFPCDAGVGGSDFDIPEGTYDFDLVPLTIDGSVIPASVVALPAPLRRTIVEGDITDLGVWQIVILNDASAN